MREFSGPLGLVPQMSATLHAPSRAHAFSGATPLLSLAVQFEDLVTARLLQSSPIANVLCVSYFRCTSRAGSDRAIIFRSCALTQ